MKDKRAKVFHGCARYLEEKTPRVFLLENVSKMNSPKTRRAFKQICRRLNTLADSGYHVEHHVMKTQEHGVPQSRSRIYFIGLRKDIVPKGYKGFNWPEKLEEVSVDPFLDRCKKRPNEKDAGSNETTFMFRAMALVGTQPGTVLASVQPGAATVLPNAVEVAGMAAMLPNAVNVQPGAATMHPNAVNFQPGAATMLPNAVNVQPGAATMHPNAVNFQPGAATMHPNAVNVQPGAATMHRNAVNVQPGAVTMHPNAVNVQPGAVTVQTGCFTCLAGCFTCLGALGSWWLARSVSSPQHMVGPPPQVDTEEHLWKDLKGKLLQQSVAEGLIVVEGEQQGSWQLVQAKAGVRFSEAMEKNLLPGIDLVAFMMREPVDETGSYEEMDPNLLSLYQSMCEALEGHNLISLASCNVSGSNACHRRFLGDAGLQISMDGTYNLQCLRAEKNNLSRLQWSACEELFKSIFEVVPKLGKVRQLADACGCIQQATGPDKLALEAEMKLLRDSVNLIEDITKEVRRVEVEVRGYGGYDYEPRLNWEVVPVLRSRLFLMCKEYDSSMKSLGLGLVPGAYPPSFTEVWRPFFEGLASGYGKPTLGALTDYVQ
eukprot:symbB.v1.2.007645.t1/scaffold473.1/size199764/3